MWNIESKWVKNQRYYVNVHQRHWAVRNTNFQVFANLNLFLTLHAIFTHLLPMHPFSTP